MALSVQYLLLRGEHLARKIGFLEFLVPRAPPFPPAGTPAVTTGIDGDPGQPRSPGNRAAAQLVPAEQFQEDLLAHIVRLIRIRQQKPTQAQNARPMGVVELVVLHARELGCNASEITGGRVRREREASRERPPAECQRSAGEWNSPATVAKKSVETDSCKPESSSADFLPVVAREFHSPAVVRVVSAIPFIEPLFYWYWV